VPAANPVWTALVAGATGLTGSALVEQLRADAHYARVIALTRQPDSIRTDAKVQEQVVNYSALQLPAEHAAVDHAFCCLGTTIRVAGSQAAFRAADFDAVLAFAQAAKRAGVQHLGVMSTLGASAQSRVFYNRVKGEMEQAVGRLGVTSVHLLRPSLLLGLRQELRLGERAGITAARIITPLLQGPWRKYRPIQVHAVARALRAGARFAQPGLQIMESHEIAQLAASLED
jgi:uncharacterized protein YbjT (DUF2867 family)